MDTYRELVLVVKAGRALLDLSQEEMADKARLSRSVIARIERNDPTVRLDTLMKVHRALEDGGVLFIPATETRSIAVALKVIPQAPELSID